MTENPISSEQFRDSTRPSDAYMRDPPAPNAAVECAVGDIQRVLDHCLLVSSLAPVMLQALREIYGLACLGPLTADERRATVEKIREAARPIIQYVNERG